MPTNQIPKLCRHKASELAYVTLNGREHYLGPWPAHSSKAPPEAQAAYGALIARWLEHGRRLPDAGPGLAMNELILAYLDWAKVKYHRPGKRDSHYRLTREAMRVVKDLFGRGPAADFGPKKLEEVQAAMVRRGWCRTTVNMQVGRVRRMIRWAVAKEFLPGDRHHALETVPDIPKGDRSVIDHEPVGPVPEHVVEATLPFLPPAVRAMVQILAASGITGSAKTRSTTSRHRSGCGSR